MLYKTLQFISKHKTTFDLYLQRCHFSLRKRPSLSKPNMEPIGTI